MMASKREQDHRIAVSHDDCARRPRVIARHMLGQITVDYDRAEIRPMASCSIEIAPILVYVIGLVTMLALSAAYKMWPVLPAKWVLRRFDQSAIYLLIATRRSWRR